MFFKLDSGWFYASLLLLYSTFAIPYVGSIYAYLIISLIFFVKIWMKRMFSKRLLVILLFLLTYFSILSLFHGKVEYYRFIYYVCWVFVSYVFLKKKGYGILYYIEKTIYYFSIISIPFYLMELFFPDMFYSFMRSVGYKLPDTLANSEHRISYNIIIYTINAIPGSFPRNSGLYFEAGYHACFLVLSLVLNYFRTRELLNRQIIISLFIIATTISTSGIVLYVFFVMYVMFFKNRLYFLLAFCGIVFLLLFFRFEFIHDKIIGAFEQVGNFDEIFYNSYAWGAVLHPDRFVSLQLGIIDLIKYPIWGRGEVYSSLGDYFYGGEIIPSSGLAHIMMYYGLSLLIVIAVLVNKFSIKAASYFSYDIAKLFFPLFVFLFSITYYIDQPIFILIYLMGLLLKKCYYENNANNL